MARNDQPIIIKRIKKAAHAHHGGAWKVAYADFVTAMMAFFLLLWLLNVTTDIERKGIADYFAPASISKSDSGAGGVFGGQSITSPGAQISDSAPPGTSKAIPEPDESEQNRKEDPGSGQPVGPDSQKKDDVISGMKVPEAVAKLQVEKIAEEDKTPPPEEALKSEDEKKKDLEKAEEEKRKAEEANFKKAEEALRQAIAGSPEMADLEKNIIIDSTPEGLRIQIVDRDGYSLFSTGSSRLADKSRKLVTLVGMVIARLPNKITVTGHTDSKPFRGLARSSNWELSSARAYSSAQIMMEAGVIEQRLQGIVGKADIEPLIKDNPEDQQNRRISIVLLRRTPETAVPAAAPAAPPAVKPAAATPPAAPSAATPAAAPAPKTP